MSELLIFINLELPILISTPNMTIFIGLRIASIILKIFAYQKFKVPKKNLKTTMLTLALVYLNLNLIMLNFYSLSIELFIITTIEFLNIFFNIVAPIFMNFKLKKDIKWALMKKALYFRPDPLFILKDDYHKKPLLINSEALSLLKVKKEMFNEKLREVFVTSHIIPKNDSCMSIIDIEPESVFLKKDEIKENVEIDCHAPEYNGLEGLLKFMNLNNIECYASNLMIKKKNETKNTRFKCYINKVSIFNQNYFIFILLDQGKHDETESIKKMIEFNKRLYCSFSHELKTPINGALPILEMLKDSEKINEESISFLDFSIGSLKILHNSIDNIINYYLFQNDQFILSKNEFTISSFLTEIDEIIQPSMTIKKLNFAIIMDSDYAPKILKSDYVRLREILLNLLTNAVQFTNSGNIKLKVDLIKEEPLTFEFCVEDTGIGIDQKTLDKIHKKLKDPENENLIINTTGSCLGLIVSEKICRLLGDKNGLHIKSCKNLGSSFSFVIISDGFNGCQSPTYRPSEVLTIYDSPNATNKSPRRQTMKLTEISRIINNSNKIEERIKRNKSMQLVKLYSHISSDIFSSDNKEMEVAKIDFEEKLNNYDFTYGAKFIEKKIKISKKFPTYRSIETLKHLTRNYRTEENSSVTMLMKCDCDQILAVDDDAFNLLSLEMILKSFNLTCCKVMSGVEAIEKLKKTKCTQDPCFGLRLVFMDYQMPLMDGVETTKRIIKMIENKVIPDITIIGCTAFVLKEQVMNCLDAGMKDVVYKPLTKNILKNIIEEWLY